MPSKKIIVIGCPGAGKSTFARALHTKTGLPLYHLDLMYWNEDRTTVEKSVFLERLSAVLSCEEWIIDGNYASSMELRMAECDTVIFLDYPTEFCLEGVRARKGVKRPDLPWIEDEDDEEFLEYIKAFHQSQRPQIFTLLECFKAQKNIIILHNREEADALFR